MDSEIYIFHYRSFTLSLRLRIYRVRFRSFLLPTFFPFPLGRHHSYRDRRTYKILTKLPDTNIYISFGSALESGDSEIVTGALRKNLAVYKWLA